MVTGVVSVTANFIYNVTPYVEDLVTGVKSDGLAATGSNCDVAVTTEISKLADWILIEIEI